MNGAKPHKPSLRLVPRAEQRQKPTMGLLKCVCCERRPADQSWGRLPICGHCAELLKRLLSRHGKAVMRLVPILQDAKTDRQRAKWANRVVKHAARLVPYEDKKLATLHPKPSDVIHLVRRKQLENLRVTFDSDIAAAIGSESGKEA